MTVGGQSVGVSGIGFKRRPRYTPLLYWDLRIANELYLELSHPISEGSVVQVTNDGSLWPTNLVFIASADPLRFNPALHVNQEGYLPDYPKKAAVGYYLGSLGEMVVPTNTFFIVEAESKARVFQGILTSRKDVGYQYTPTPYRRVYEADFSSLTNPGTYYLAVPGMGASLPFRIDEGVAMAFARTYELGMFHQRGGFNVAMPFTRFTHAADHLSPALVPTNDSAPFAFTWQTVSNYSSEVNPDNPPQVAPGLTNYPAQLFPFVNQGKVSVFGGHFEAGDYNRVTYNAAQLVHNSCLRLTLCRASAVWITSAFRKAGTALATRYRKPSGKRIFSRGCKIEMEDSTTRSIRKIASMNLTCCPRMETHKWSGQKTRPRAPRPLRR